jgi:Domain of unknown function (DUF4260)
VTARLPMSERAESGLQPTANAGVVAGAVRAILRLEGAAALVAAAALYFHRGFPLSLFAVFFLAPDLAMLGYLAGPRIGAAGYNAAHTYALALPLALFGLLAQTPIALGAALIWIAHLGFDRALGYGLKRPTRFGDTHLGTIGRAPPG